MKQRKWIRFAIAVTLAFMTFGTAVAEAAGVLTIGRREDSTTFDPISTVQNVDFWVFMNVYDVLIRVDKTGAKLEPGLAESWDVSDDGLVYTFHMRDAKFSDGSPITAEDAMFTLTRVRNDEGSHWGESYTVVSGMAAPDPHTFVVTLKEASAPFLASLAMPGVSIISKNGFESMGVEAYAENPVASGAFTVAEWQRGERVVLKKNPNFWQADRVQLDGIEWIAIPDDNTRVLKVQAGELDAAIFVPFSRIGELQKDPNLQIHLDPSTREDHLLINHTSGALAIKEVRQALDMAIDKQAIVDAVTFGIGEVAYSFIPKGALYHNYDNLRRPHDPAKAKQMLAAAGASDLTLNYIISAGDEVDEQIGILLQQQLAEAGVTVNLQKMDPSSTWDLLVDGEFDVSVMYWTNDILDPDQKTTFVVGHDPNNNYHTRYKNETVKQLVADARVQMDPAKREQMYIDIQKMAKEDAHWIDLYYSPYRNVSRSNIEGFYQNPLGRIFLEDTVKN